MILNINNQVVKNAAGEDKRMGDFAGNTLLIVNVASKCGLTPQYTGLEALNKKYQARGLRILGFPCNQFAGQEPGSMEDILTFCSTKYDVTFDIMQKIEVNGAGRSPLYEVLTKATPASDIQWNFEKFLVDRHGNVIKRFASTVTPDNPELVGAIEAALGKA